MKRLKIILVSTLLMGVSAMAMTSKPKEESKVIYTVLEGNSTNIIGKRGLAVDLSYKSEHVEVGESSDINITLYTEMSTGSLKVNLKALDDDLDGIDEEDLEFELSNNTKTFPINIQVSSSVDGIHYINVTVEVEGEGSRVLAVPVNVGVINNKINSKAVEITNKGMTISVSSAQEEIK